MKKIEMMAAKLAPVAAVIDDGQFRWAVNRTMAEEWLRTHEVRTEEDNAEFCRAVPLLVKWTVGTPEMISLCRALRDMGAPMYRI